MTTLTQTTTDTLSLEDFGPVTFATITWGTKSARRHAVATKLVSTAALGQVARRSRPVDFVANLPGLILLTEDGLRAIRLFGGTALYNPHLDLPIHPDVAHEDLTLVSPTNQANKADEVRALLTSLGSSISDHVFVSHSPEGLWPLDAPVSDPPLNLPLYFNISNRYIHVDQALPHLKTHPAVRFVSFNRGRPGSYDHVPSYLHLIVQFDDPTYTALNAYAAKNQRYGKPPHLASSSTLESAFVYNATKPTKSLGDPLGLSPFARTESYREPGDDEDDW